MWSSKTVDTHYSDIPNQPQHQYQPHYGYPPYQQMYPGYGAPVMVMLPNGQLVPTYPGVNPQIAPTGAGMTQQPLDQHKPTKQSGRNKKPAVGVEEDMESQDVEDEEDLEEDQSRETAEKPEPQQRIKPKNKHIDDPQTAKTTRNPKPQASASEAGNEDSATPITPIGAKEKRLLPKVPHQKKSDKGPISKQAASSILEPQDRSIDDEELEEEEEDEHLNSSNLSQANKPLNPQPSTQGISAIKNPQPLKPTKHVTSDPSVNLPTGLSLAPPNLNSKPQQQPQSHVPNVVVVPTPLPSASAKPNINNKQHTEPAPKDHHSTNKTNTHPQPTVDRTPLSTNKAGQTTNQRHPQGSHLAPQPHTTPNHIKDISPVKPLAVTPLAVQSHHLGPDLSHPTTYDNFDIPSETNFKSSLGGSHQPLPVPLSHSNNPTRNNQQLPQSASPSIDKQSTPQQPLPRNHQSLNSNPQSTTTPNIALPPQNPQSTPITSNTIQPPHKPAPPESTPKTPLKPGESPTDRPAHPQQQTTKDAIPTRPNILAPQSTQPSQQPPPSTTESPNNQRTGTIRLLSRPHQSTNHS